MWRIQEKKTHIFLVDERFVPFDNPESNYGMIRDKLLSKVPIPRKNVHPIKTEETTQLSANAYEGEIKRFFDLKEKETPRFDLILLGVGKDGHVASLFAGDNALYEKKHLVAAAKQNHPKYERVTITLPVVNYARNVIFFIIGKNKSKIVKEILQRKKDSIPASLVKPKNGKLLFILGSGAGSLLR